MKPWESGTHAHSHSPVRNPVILTLNSTLSVTSGRPPPLVAAATDDLGLELAVEGVAAV